MFSEIVFARTKKKALTEYFDRLEGGFQCGITDFAGSELEIKRAPHYDRYSMDGKVPVEVLLADGFQFYCRKCRVELTYADYERGNLTITGDSVYCSYCAEEE
jgi:hypothetical protein